VAKLPGGYMGKILRVNLTEGTLRDEMLSEDVLKMWLGGRGLGVYLMLKEVDPRVDPLSPENKLIILTGPLTGTAAPESGRWCSVTKAPLTGTIHDSHSGGKWGPELKFAGYDGIIIEGASEKPVYLWIHNGKAELRDAKHLWGKDTHATTDILIEELGDKNIKVMCIGPAGENLVKFACLINDKGRAAGRGGHGAVMGSKKLKAIAVRGTMKPKIANESRFREAVKLNVDKIKKHPVTGEALPKYGTAVLVNIINKHGILPTRNFQTGVHPTADKYSGETIAEKTLIRRVPCWGCIIACGRYTKISDAAPFQGEGDGPEYETVWAFGAQTGTDDLAAISKANFLCNELGLDTISMGHVIGTLMELYEKGKVPIEKLRGLEPKWGNRAAIVELTWRTAYRSGIGDDLAEGAKKLAEKYGAPELAMVVRGQELPAYDPRGVQGHGLGYATSNRGGCHLRSYMIAPEVLGVPQLVDRFTTNGKAELVKTFQDGFAVIDSLVLCKFNTFATWVEDWVGMVAGATGWNITLEELTKIGERIYNAERVFNILAFGDGRAYDTLPRRLLVEPMPEGPARGHTVKLDEMLEEYYNLRGWVDGRPTREKLEELGLKEFADKLEEKGLLPK